MREKKEVIEYLKKRHDDTYAEESPDNGANVDDLKVQRSGGDVGTSSNRAGAVSVGVSRQKVTEGILVVQNCLTQREGAVRDENMCVRKVLYNQ
jgi:hypothetical protein